MEGEKKQKKREMGGRGREEVEAVVEEGKKRAPCHEHI